MSCMDPAWQAGTGSPLLTRRFGRKAGEPGHGEHGCSACTHIQTRQEHLCTFIRLSHHTYVHAHTPHSRLGTMYVQADGRWARAPSPQSPTAISTWRQSNPATHNACERIAEGQEVRGACLTYIVCTCHAARCLRPLPLLVTISERSRCGF